MALKNLEKLKYMPTFTIPTAFSNALTYTEMIGKMTKAVNECIESIEAFGKEVEEKLNAQDSEIDNKFVDYDRTIAEKFKSQDVAINEYYNRLVETTNNYVEQTNALYRNFVDEVNSGILEFQRRVDSDIENFQRSVNDTVDEQNIAIANAVDYMKTNIDSVASGIVTEKIANGEIFVNLVYDNNTRDLSIKLYDNMTTGVVEENTEVKESESNE